MEKLSSIADIQLITKKKTSKKIFEYFLNNYSLRSDIWSSLSKSIHLDWDFIFTHPYLYWDSMIKTSNPKIHKKYMRL